MEEETNNDELNALHSDYEPFDQYRGQQHNSTDSDPMREMRYRDINEPTRHQDIGSYAYEAQSEYNISSSKKMSSTYNSYVRHEDGNNLPFGSIISSFFGSVEQYPQYFTIDDDEVIQPTPHSF
jgi:hypothetical protein